MFEKIGNFFNKMMKPEVKELTSKDAAKERLHLVLMQDRANVSVDFLELMKQEIIDVIKKYIVVDENAIDVRLTNQENADGTNGAPSLYANIPIINIKNDVKAEKIKDGILMYENGELEKVPVQDEQVAQDSKNLETDENTEENIETVDETEFVEQIPSDLVTTEEPVQEIIENNENVEDVTSDTVAEENNEENIEISAEEDDEELVIQSEEDDEAIEPITDFSEDKELDDEDGEDITFDDLLKKAEEEEKLSQEDADNDKTKTQNKKKKTNKKKKR